jgi:hypothetical protein
MESLFVSMRVGTWAPRISVQIRKGRNLGLGWSYAGLPFRQITAAIQMKMAIIPVNRGRVDVQVLPVAPHDSGLHQR